MQGVIDRRDFRQGKSKYFRLRYSAFGFRRNGNGALNGNKIVRRKTELFYISETSNKSLQNGARSTEPVTTEPVGRQ